MCVKYARSEVILLAESIYSLHFIKKSAVNGWRNVTKTTIRLLFFLNKNLVLLIDAILNKYVTETLKSLFICVGLDVWMLSVERCEDRNVNVTKYKAILFREMMLRYLGVGILSVEDAEFA